MYLADTHTHTWFSTDSKADPKLCLKAANEKGLSALCFTDHMDLDFPEDSSQFVFDPKRYFEELLPLKDASKKESTKLFLGIELGIRPSRPDLNVQMEKLLADYPFDYAIGSTHIVDDMDPYEEKYWRKPGDRLLHYFEDIYTDISEFQSFDSLGHLDYVIRYLPDFVAKEKDYSPADYIEIMTKILKVLIANGKALEINTGGLRKGLSFVHPKREILSLYRSLGGELLTLGSDAHFPKDIAADFSTAVDLLQNLGFRYYTVFTERKPRMHSLV